MSDLTTLQLAERIARAVVTEHEDCWYLTGDVRADVITQAVLKVLYETNSWFCRLEDTPKGTGETVYEQVELFK